MDIKKLNNVVILGMGVSGRAVQNFLMKRNIPCFGVDRKPETSQHIKIVQEEEEIDFRGADLIIKSPGIPLSHRWLKAAKEKHIPIMGEIDLALQEIQNKKVIAITGSNGKTTTTLFTTHLLNISGKRALAVGNVGLPLISQLDSDAEFFVLELSSFQLENILEKPVFDAAVVLNITPNHLDRHSSYAEYVHAKLRIQKCLKEKGRFLVSEHVAKEFRVKAEIFDFYKEKIETIFSLRYRDGKLRFFPHDFENFSAAYAASSVSDEDFYQAISTFQKPPHRIEFVRDINGVSFFNDSKATSIDAVIKAVSSVEGRVLLLAGGIDKGGSFKDWIPFFRKKVLKIWAMGPAAIRIENELSEEFPVEKVSSMEEGIKKAALVGLQGDVVLLSPGCASYDQFKDFQHRGERFKEIVFAI